MNSIMRLAVSTLLIVSGCATASNPYVGIEAADGESAVFRYGNFCGPGWPSRLEEMPKEDRGVRIEYLESQEPVDTIDSLCKKHDLCYEEFGHDFSSCDNAFGRTVGNLSNAFNETGRRQGALGAQQCGRLSYQVSSAFIYKRRQVGGSLWDAVNTLPFRVGAGAFTAASFAGGDDPANYPVEGSCSLGGYEATTEFDLNFYRHLCINRVHTISYERAISHADANSTCKEPPMYLADSAARTTFIELEAEWARAYCLKDMRPTNFLTGDITGTVALRYKNLPACRRYMVQTSMSSAEIVAPWGKYLNRR